MTDHQATGFPSPATDYIEDTIDLNRELIKRPLSTFFIRIKTHFYAEVGLYKGMLVIVDRSLKPLENDIVVVQHDGELSFMRVTILDNQLSLIPVKKRSSPIPITPTNEWIIWGVVLIEITQRRL